MSRYTVRISHFGYHSGRVISCSTEEDAIFTAIEMSGVDLVRTTVISPDGVIIAEYQNKYLTDKE